MTGGLINFLCTVNLSFFDFTCTRSVCGLRSFWQFCSICASTRSPSLSRIDTELGGAACAKISWRSFPSTSTRKVGKDQWLASRLHRKISIISLPGSIKVNLRVLGGSVFCQSYCVAQHYHYAHYVEQCYMSVSKVSLSLFSFSKKYSSIVLTPWSNQAFTHLLVWPLTFAICRDAIFALSLLSLTWFGQEQRCHRCIATHHRSLELCT